MNHNISPEVEHEDIKRFKNEISKYLDIPITYANMDGWERLSPLDVCMQIKAFKVGNGTALCTNRLKTAPFYKWLDENYPSKPFDPRPDVTIVYGFDKNEPARIQRRVGVMASRGYLTDYPLACWDRTIENTEEIGINRPITYQLFRHANCIGCLKAGRQQWYIVYCTRPDIWAKALEAEEQIGYSIIKGIYLKELESKFTMMKCAGIVPSEEMNPATFWSKVRSIIPSDSENLPCECAI